MRGDYMQKLSDEVIKERDCCNNCIYYRSFIKHDKETKRGHCDINKRTYKQRTETCKKFTRGE